MKSIRNQAIWWVESPRGNRWASDLTYRAAEDAVKEAARLGQQAWIWSPKTAAAADRKEWRIRNLTTDQLLKGELT